jgi:SAM-dependent methyltransferase
MLAEARRRDPRLRLVEGDALHLPVRSRAVDLVLFILALEFVDDPGTAFLEAVRVARRGVIVVALHRWSAGGWSRRWGRDARRPLLGAARDVTRRTLGALATAAGPRVRGHRWASALFPLGAAGLVARLPLGQVIGLGVELEP